jgi:hypothetical protein
MRGIKLSIRSLSRRKKDLFIADEDDDEDEEDGGMVVGGESESIRVESGHDASKEEEKESQLDTLNEHERDSDSKDVKRIEELRTERNEPHGKSFLRLVISSFSQPVLVSFTRKGE